MIRAIIELDEAGNYKGFSCSGHAGFARKGKDIVCASVSVLVINTANAIDQLTDADFKASQDDNIITFEFESIPDEKSRLLMDAMIIGLNEIQKSYGRKYLELELDKIPGGN